MKSSVSQIKNSVDQVKDIIWGIKDEGRWITTFNQQFFLKNDSMNGSYKTFNYQ
jgi:hypothetical protein